MVMSQEAIRTWVMFMKLLNKTIAARMPENSLNCATRQGGKIVHPQVAVSKYFNPFLKRT